MEDKLIFFPNISRKTQVTIAGFNLGDESIVDYSNHHCSLNPCPLSQGIPSYKRIKNCSKISPWPLKFKIRPMVFTHTHTHRVHARTWSYTDPNKFKVCVMCPCVCVCVCKCACVCVCVYVCVIKKLVIYPSLVLRLLPFGAFTYAMGWGQIFLCWLLINKKFKMIYICWKTSVNNASDWRKCTL